MFKFGENDNAKKFNLKIILQGNDRGVNDKEYYCNLNTLQLNVSFKNYYQRIIGIYKC